MINVKGLDILTLNVTAGNVYEIEYDQISTLNIFNFTDGSVFLSLDRDCNYSFINNVGNFLTIGSGNGFNDFIFYTNKNNKVYLKPDSNGYISLYRKLW